MRRIKTFFQQFFLINDSPHKIAGGAALGIFFGIAPGEGVATTLVVASLLRLNRLAATAGVLATNMWTTALILPLAAAVGGFLFGTSSSALIHEFQTTFHTSWKLFFSKIVFFQIALPLLVGFVLVSAVIAGTFYVVIFFILKFHSRKWEKFS